MTITTTALRLSDSFAGSLGLLNRPLDPDTLIRTARRQTGLDDFGDASFTEPLIRLLESCSSKSALGIVGRSATKWDVVRFLSNLLILQDAAKRAPEIGTEPISRPVFITGLPRSGTTFLHRLMLTDPVNRAPAVWETISPSARTGTRAQRIARVARQLQRF